MLRRKEEKNEEKGTQAKKGDHFKQNVYYLCSCHNGPTAGGTAYVRVRKQESGGGWGRGRCSIEKLNGEKKLWFIS